MFGREGRVALLAVSTTGILGVFFVGPIPQDPSYHWFADTRVIAGVANFWNVVSNIPILLVAAFGLWRLPRLDERETRMGYFILCVAVALVGFGGHALKHVVAAVAVLCIVLAVPAAATRVTK